ncbi:MAG: hypothetical protein ABIB04_04475 [Patescibacteria group bacterium]
MLSPEGVSLARRIGSEQMRGKGYTYIAVTSHFRTAQTAAAMAEGAGDFTCTNLIMPSALNSAWLSEWSLYFQEHDANLVPENGFIVSESLRMAIEFHAICMNFPSNVHLLGVGYTPFIECLVYGLTDEIIAPLKECEGVILGDDGDGFKLFEVIRL